MVGAICHQFELFATISFVQVQMIDGLQSVHID